MIKDLVVFFYLSLKRSPNPGNLSLATSFTSYLTSQGQLQPPHYDHLLKLYMAAEVLQLFFHDLAYTLIGNNLPFRLFKVVRKHGLALSTRSAEISKVMPDE